MNQAQKQCPNCQQYKMMPRWFNVFILGLALITTIPTLMLIAAITVVGLLIEPFLFILLPIFVGLGVLVLIATPFVKGSECKNCKLVIKPEGKK